PTDIEYGKGIIVRDLPTIPGDIGGPKWNKSHSCREAHGNLIGQTFPTIGHILPIATVPGPSEGIAMQTGISRAGHLEDPLVGVVFFKLLRDHLVPGQTVDIVNL